MSDFGKPHERSSKASPAIFKSLRRPAADLSGRGTAAVVVFGESFKAILLQLAISCSKSAVRAWRGNVNEDEFH